MSNISSVLASAQTLTDNEQYDQAYELLKKHYESGRGDAEFIEKIALAAQILGKKDETTEYFEELIKVKPDSMVAYTELQDIYNDTNRYKYYMTRAKIKVLNRNVNQAIPDYKKAIENTSDESEKDEAYILSARAYEFMGKLMNAIDEYYKLTPAAKNEEIYAKIAELYIADNDKYSALNVLEQAIEHYPENDILKDFAAKLCIETDNTEKAERYAVSKFLKIKIKLLQGKNDDAFKLLEAAEDKNEAEYLKLAAEYYFNKSDWEKCLECIDNFAKAMPGHPLIYQMKSLVYDNQNKPHEAHVYRAKMYAAKEQEDIALHEFMQAHKVDPSNIQTIEEIIRICEKTGEKHTAAEFYEKILKLEPKNEHALVKSGDFYFDMGEYVVASEYYERAAESSILPEVYLKCGKCFEKLKRGQRAKDYYERYLAKAPIGPEVEIIKNKISTFSADGSTEAEEEGFLEKFIGFFSKKRT